MTKYPWIVGLAQLVLWPLMILSKFLVRIPGYFIVAWLYRFRDVQYETVLNVYPWTKPWLNVEDWTGQPNNFDGSLPRWWVEEMIPVYSNWYDRPLNAIKALIWLVVKMVKQERVRHNWLQETPYNMILRGSGFWSFYTYHQRRNGSNGLRTIDPFRLTIESDLVQYRSTYLTPGAARDGDMYTPFYMKENDIKTAAYVAWQGWKMGIKIVHIWNDSRHLEIKLGWRVRPGNLIEIDLSQGTVQQRQRKLLLLANASFASKILIYRSTK